MLEGLEVSEVLLSESNSVTRLDSEYFRPVLISLQKRLEALPHTTLGAKSRFVAGPFGSEFHVDNYDERSPYRYVRGKDVKSFFIENTDNVYLPEPDFNRLNDHSIKAGDVLISVVGTLGNSCIATERDTPAIFSCKSTVIRKPEVNPYYLVSYLNSEPGKSLLLRCARGSVQLGLNLPDLRQYLIPTFGNVLQDATERTIRAAHKSFEIASEHLAIAEQTLLRTLGLENWQPPEPLAYTRPSRDAFAAGRLDAEHFKPKYVDLEAHIRATSSFTTLENLLAINERGTQPDYAESGLPVINSKHVANGEVRLNDGNRVAMAGSNAMKIKQGDVLMNGTGVGTIGRAAPFLHDAEALPDNHVTILRPQAGAIDSVYLSVYLNSLAGQYQVSKWLRGSSGQIELYPNDIAQFLVWIAPTEVQQAIRKAIDDAFTAKRNATRLLDAAKRAVEIAIESGEASALEFLNREITPQ
ncbi:hypothetical protein [Thiobacillus sp.]|uniref:restriction endonuclease subunit S n=1 Tax=Thiobacillus sp. TaxID=924 RepID=UPI0025E42D18|nr:hypothetical protein [Thiobacillus sp.]